MLLSLLCVWDVLAAQPAMSPSPVRSSDPVRVGLYVSPPFVMKDAKGDYVGMAVELWEAAAKDLGWEYEYVEKPTLGSLIKAVATEELDVAVTNLTITQGRAMQIDFTHPWYDAGLRVMVADGAAGHGRLFTALHQSGHLRTYAGLGILVLFATWLLTVFDRKHDREFPREWGDGLAESFYHVMSVATSGKTSRKMMFGSAGRVLAAIWMLCGVALIAYITSSVTSVMTTMSLARHVNGVGDLPGKTIGVLSGSTAESFAGAMRFDFRRYANIDAAAHGLSDGGIVAVVADAPVLEYYTHSRPGDGTAVVGNIFSPEKYGFGLQRGSVLSKPLTIQLLGMHESGYVGEVREKYFGSHY